MIKVSNIDPYGWEAAIRGMRNPMNSWDRSDSTFWNKTKGSTVMVLGENDLKLMRNLYQSGTEHRKFMRMIHVSMDICAPLYWWKEFDTYKVGTVANSCSTMHKIHAKEFTPDDFSHEKLTGNSYYVFAKTINVLNNLRDEYNKTKDRNVWYQMIQLLPTNYNQQRTVDLNYEVAATIIKQRAGHKLDEWRELVAILRGLPYMMDICVPKEK